MNGITFFLIADSFKQLTTQLGLPADYFPSYFE